MSHETTVAIVVASIAASATIITASIAALSAYLSGKRDRRRNLYGEAYRAGLGWLEMLYRVRRRAEGAERELVGQFHELQEQITHYSGWLGSESRYMMRSYKKLVTAVKTKTEPLITAAWADDLRPASGNATQDDSHPDLDAEAELFLRDVRSYLSPWQVRKIAVMWRNRAGS